MENINWNHPKCSAVSNDVHPGFTFPNYHQIHMLTIIFYHQLHNETQIFADSVLAQPFATLMNAMIMKWFNQPTMRQEDVNKLIKHGLDQAKFLSMLEPIL